MKLSCIMPCRNSERWILTALQSFPIRDDVELIVIDDNSSDETYALVNAYKRHTPLRITLIHNDTQIYPCGCMNKGIDIAQGEYFTQTDSDDYLLTEKFCELLDQNRHEDLVFFWNEINNFDVWKPELIDGLCDHICWYKKDFVKDYRQPNEGKWGMGFPFHRHLLSLNPTKYYHQDVIYHYNFPREGSTYDLGKKGLL